MGKSKALFAGLCAVALVGTMGLAGCTQDNGSQNSSQGANSEQQNTAEPTASEPAEEVVLQIFAANSLTKAMADAQALYTEQHPNVKFGDTQYEGSGTLNEMLGAGQYADILITASKGTMDTAEEKGYVDAATRQTMFTNQLVIVTKAGGPLVGQDITLEQIAAGEYTLSVGDENVPAGNYAAQSLSTVGAYTEPDGATGADATGTGGEWSASLLPKITFGAKVGDVCKYAETGDVDIALVYTSDVYRMGGVEICSIVPDDTHKAIVYPGAVTAQSENAQAAADFLEWCMTDDDCAKIWQEWGFDIAA
ncbi:molybdate ABC transporter substrate-binding protein [Parvibacter caecicola]|uniref:Molybdate transport system substrate-binding protein n=1 Tax=Parvibacter caecicola TaxID=747645 RepID=A0A7W5CZY6_9ACTN|nr:extracellular solute-binding protein [Parvibacter caecicola]MBB3170363.1 molybdate transport system substrate-binding protein [Parvibacter caecicola]MCR2041672.1 extracellular solute-binding protein [Parvibacter caecicola]RNL12232.1 molybdenum ABC transporter substrate-binding protein [Parvibacter caecicola]